MAVVAVPLLLKGTGLWCSGREQRAAANGLRYARSDAAAERITGFETGIQDQPAGATNLPWDVAGDLALHCHDALRAPADLLLRADVVVR